MTPQEFKAWLEGFSEAIKDAPTPEQWEMVKAKVAKIEALNLKLPSRPQEYRRSILPIPEPTAEYLG